MRQPPTGRTRDDDRRVSLPEGELRVRLLGRGPAILFLHGLSSHAGVWERPARRLAERHTLILPDLLGRGRSEARADVPYRLVDETARVGGLLAALDVDPDVVVGHSQGAALALALEEGAGRRRGLVLVCPVTPWTRRPAILELLRMAPLRRLLSPVLSRLRRPLGRRILRTRVYGDPSRADAAAVDRYVAPYADPRRSEALLRALADWRPAELASRLPIPASPTRVLAGGFDRRIPPAAARRLAAVLDARMEVIPGAGHLLPEEAPDAVARAVDAVYAEVDRPERA